MIKVSMHLFGIGLVCLLAAMELKAQVIKVACIGDSITEGVGVDNPGVNAYPVLLGRLLGTNSETRNPPA